jgi:hypothetical protein
LEIDNKNLKKGATMNARVNMYSSCKFLFTRFIQCLILISLFTEAMLSQNYQSRSRTELMNDARIAFSGAYAGHKNGPLVKMGFDLALLREEFRDHAALQTLTPFKPSNPMLHVTADKVAVDIIALNDPASLESDLKALGMKITGKAGGLVSGLLPITSIEGVAALPTVRSARPAMWKTNIGLTTSQGDSSMHSNLVRSSLGYNGTGVTVGVLSDSYNYLLGAATDVASGDLPGVGNPYGHTTPVNVLADAGSTDEGRAMLQLIHDVAPGAHLAFATANGGQATFANHIDSLRRIAGSNIIVDDVFYYFEPMFQDGIIAQAVDTVVAAGVPYFSSAGNQARQSYESVWRTGQVRADGAIGAVSGLHFYGGTTFDFDPGAGVDDMQSFTLGNNQYVTIVLQWDSPFASTCAGCPGSSNDLDFYLLNSAGTQVLASGAYNNINTDAVEGLQFVNTTGLTATFNIMIVKYSGSNPGFLKYINFDYPQGSLQFATNSSTIFGHANSAGAEAVGAAAYYNTPAFGVTPPVLESFSSVGPTAIRFNKLGAPAFDARADKPEITAPDGTNTTFFGSDIEPDGYPNFFGTSAAAPHAAAVAALMLDANASATPAQIYSKLESTAIDMGTVGFDNNSGFGLIQADAAVNSVLPVEIVSFTGTVERNFAVLRWSTATETNNYGFEVEKRTVNSGNAAQTADGDSKMKSWRKIGFISGNGTCNTLHGYSYSDANPGTGHYAYRLKQIDHDGTFKYSGSVEIEIKNMPTIYSLAQNYPNPFNPSTIIRFGLPARSMVKLEIFNILGQTIATLVEGEKEAGFVEAIWQANGATGLYIYRLEAVSSENPNQRFVDVKKMMLLR